ncbi:MAG: hypothetical protein K1X94_07795 [Sandaracinaceae bacterium]|nr:hypothetical protein [Sandaracinaceae bacterium]
MQLRLGWVIPCLALTLAAPALAQQTDGSTTADAVPPPPSATVSEVPPAPQQQVEVAPAPQVVTVAPQTAVPDQSATAAAYGQPVYQGTPQVYPEVAAPRRRGDHLEDTANAGEVVDLMITGGAYGVFLANSIITWADLDDTSFDPITGTSRRSSDDVVRIRFVGTLLGATLSLTGLLAADAPRGVPTTMAMGLRYGTAFAGFGAGAAGADGDAMLAAMSLGGVIGLGIGAGLGFGLRPHTSRSRFVESGFLWGTAFGGMLAGAFSNTDGRAVLGGMLAGSLGAMLAHSLVASLTPVHVGRGWLMNAAFAAGSGLAAFFTWGFGGSGVSGETYLATMSATGFVALAVVFAVTDGIQDAGWDESELPEVVRNMSLDVSPTQGGAVGTIRGQF